MIDFHELRLISKMRAGRPEAYTEIYDRCAARLLSYALRLSGDRADAEDLLQETMLAAWQGRATFQGRVRLLSWLLGIMSRRWRDGCRQHRVVTVSLTVEDGEMELPLPVASSSGLETCIIDRVTIDDALAILDLPFREALLLIHSQQLSYKEAADVLGEPVGTVKWRVSEALKRVHRQLAACEEEIDALRQTSAGAVG